MEIQALFKRMRKLCFLGWLVCAFPAGLSAQRALGEFEKSADVGAVEHRGAVEYNPGANTYRITGGGANMWAGADAFHFLWRAASGDISITADFEWVTSGGNAHKKAGPILRSGLAPDDAYADLVAHQDGLIALQFRRTKGGTTEELRTSIKAPATLRLERHGEVISAEVAPIGGAFQPIGALSLSLPETVYAGLAVCSHDVKVAETALFSRVAVRNDGVVDLKQRLVESTLETIEIETGQRRIIHRETAHFEAPNWSPDGRFLFYNGGGKLYRIPAGGGTPEPVETGALRLNNDHGLSPDGRQMAISGAASGGSQIWIVPATGGEPRLVVGERPSYWHGWSPDGKTLAYCAQRNGEYDIYTISVDGGEERRLTTAPGLDDGPDYSPDGQWIYFNSERTGLMRIWRMRVDGSGQEMVSVGAPSGDWFPHPSPDGRWLVYLSYDPSVKGHPPNKDVQLKIMPPGGEPRVLATLFGGQGTINVPSWSPDSKRFAFVSYRLVARKTGQ
jgi:TolB protein